MDFITELLLYRSDLTDQSENPQGSLIQSDSNNVVMYNEWRSNGGQGDLVAQALSLTDPTLEQGS